MMNLAEVIAREHIRDLVARYNSLGDSGRFAAAAALFTEDGLLEVSDPSRSVVARGRPQIERLFSDVSASWSETVSGPGRYVRHYVGTHVIDVESDHDALGVAYVLVFRSCGTVSSGRYFDRYHRQDGQWLFQHRRARSDTDSVASNLEARSPGLERPDNDLTR